MPNGKRSGSRGLRAFLAVGAALILFGSLFGAVLAVAGIAILYFNSRSSESHKRDEDDEYSEEDYDGNDDDGDDGEGDDGGDSDD